MSKISRRAPRVAVRSFVAETLESRRLLATIVVNTATDGTFPQSSGLTSLRMAIATANAATTPTTITFDTGVFASKQTSVLNGTELAFTNGKQSTTIVGPSSGLVLDADSASRVFNIHSGVKVSLSKLTATRGVSGYGGDVYNTGNLTLADVSLTAGKVTGSGYGGGGIYTVDGVVAPSSLTMTDCTVSGNSAAGDAGGLLIQGAATLTQVTIANNTSGAQGGGIESTGTDTLLQDCTVSGNSVTSTYFLDGGGGIASSSNPSGTSSFTIVNTVVAGNTSASTGPDVYGTFNSLGNNLVGKTDASTGFNGVDRTGTVAKPLDAKLGSLASNGGLTLTLLPQTGSPLIDHGSNSLIPSGTTTDQRGATRIVNGTVDIGAVETAATTAAKLTVTAAAAQSATAGVAKSFSLGSFTTTDATSPYTVTVDWGDGSTKTTFTMSAAGTITAQSHTYAKSGSDTISVTVTDAKSNKSNTATTGVTVTAATTNTASIAGTVFSDTDGNGVKATGEAGLAGVALYNDANNNSKEDAGEATATTDSSGNYKFTGLAAGTYKIRQVLPGGYTQTSPTGGLGQGVTLTAGQAATGKNFGDKPAATATASIAGTVFNDADGDKTFDAAELGLGGYQVFLDTNKNGTLDSGETVVTTDADGLFGFTGLAAGTYTVRVVQRTKTAATTSNPLTITLTSGKASTGNLFGEKRIA